MIDSAVPATGEELFRWFLLGDQDAFEDLVAMYQEGLSNFIYGIVQDRHEAEHLTIEAFARLAVGGKKFAWKSSLKTYLYTIGRNLSLRYLKMRGREQHICYEEVVGVLASDGESPESAFIREEGKHRLQTALNALKEDHQTVLTLLYFEGMSYLQAGQTMRKSENQIRHLAFRAKGALRRRLEADGYSAQ